MDAGGYKLPESIKMNSGSLKISVSSRMYNLSIYFICILVLTYVSYSSKILLERGVGYMLYVGFYCDSLKGAWRTTGSNGSDNRACLSPKDMDCLEKKCALMIGVFEYLLALLEVLGMLSVGTGAGVVD